MTAAPFDPGVPVARYLAIPLCGGVTFYCQTCAARRTLPVATVCAHLRRLGFDPAATGVRALFRYVRRPCEGCGGLAFEVRPHFPGIPGQDGLTAAP